MGPVAAAVAFAAEVSVASVLVVASGRGRPAAFVLCDLCIFTLTFVSAVDLLAGLFLFLSGLLGLLLRDSFRGGAGVLGSGVRSAAADLLAGLCGLSAVLLLILVGLAATVLVRELDLIVLGLRRAAALLPLSTSVPTWP